MGSVLKMVLRLIVHRRYWAHMPNPKLVGQLLRVSPFDMDARTHHITIL